MFVGSVDVNYERLRGHRWECHAFAWRGLTHHARAADALLDSGAKVRYDWHRWNADPTQWLGRGDLKTLRECHAAVSVPWKEGIETVRTFAARFRKQVIKPPVSVRRRQVWDVVGDHYDLDRHRAGLEPWRKSERAVRQGPRLVTLVANLSGNCNVRASDLAMTGVACVTLSDLLEAAGFSVRVLACDFIASPFREDPLECLLQTWEVKPAGRPVALYALVNGLSAWFWRSLSFSSHYMVPGRTPVECHGRAVPLRVEAINHLVRSSGSNAVYFMEGVHNEEKCVGEVRRILAQVDLIVADQLRSSV